MAFSDSVDYLEQMAYAVTWSALVAPAEVSKDTVQPVAGVEADPPEGTDEV